MRPASHMGAIKGEAMREKKFTPGPWFFSDQMRTGVVTTTDRENDNMVEIAAVDVVWDEPFASEQIANANLIAEAPALLYACEFLVNVCETAPPVELIKQISDACIIAKQAIAKAYGE